MRKSEGKTNKYFNLKEMRQHKVKATVYIIIRVITVALLVLSIVRGHWENVMTCIMSLILLLIPLFLEKRLKVRLPSVLEIIVITFVFAANIMGELGAFYEKIPLWDTALHTMNGFICAGVGFGLIDILNRNDNVKINLSPLFVCLFSFCFSMTAGTVWEFFEFGMDMLFGKDMQKDTVITTINSMLLSGQPNVIERINDIGQTLVDGKSLGINGYLDIGLIDTMKDLLVNFVGAVVFNVAGFFYIKSRTRVAAFVKNFIPQHID